MHVEEDAQLSIEKDPRVVSSWKNRIQVPILLEEF